MNTSVISSTVSPLRRAARTCMPISFSARIEISAARVIALRIRRSIPGRDQAPPQAYRVMNSCQGWPKLPAFAAARSTCSSPSTSRRVFIPVSKSFIGQEPQDHRGGQVGPLDGGQMGGGRDDLEPRTRDQPSDLLP